MSHRTANALALLLAALLALAGCASEPPCPAPRRARPLPDAAPVTLSAAAEHASLWPRDRAGQCRASIAADQIARSRGDVVTVLVHEAQTATNTESTDLKQDTHLLAQLNSVTGLLRPFHKGAGLPGAEVTSSREFKADGLYNKDGMLETRISAVIVDVQPNGNLVIEGTRAVRVDDETKTVKITGIVRPLDLTSSNTVLSENVAEACVSYEGDGPLTRNGKRGLVGTIGDMLVHHLWPF